MSILVIAEVSARTLAVDTTRRVVAAASQLGDVTLLVCGPASAAAEAASIGSVHRVLLAEGPACEDGLAENVAQLIAGISGEFSHVICAASNAGKNLLPRLAGLLDVMVLTDVTEILDSETFKRPIYAGNAIQTVRSREKVKLVSVRTSSFAPTPFGDAAPIEQVSGSEAAGLSRILEERVAISARPDLGAARIVVSGGRGIGSDTNFALINDLADQLGAAVGASRAAVDAGYAPNDLQVGQTGKVVAPELYIAVGISGAIQHLAGMKDSKVIVAINKDPDAPIFQVADYGLVADLFEAVPAITAALK